MPLKPDGRIAPSADEFSAWQSHPVTQFVAEAYRIAAEKNRAEWERYFDAPMIPADIAMQRAVLRTREDAYRSILENTLADYLAIVEGAEPRRSLRAAQPRKVARQAGY